MRQIHKGLPVALLLVCGACTLANAQSTTRSFGGSGSSQGSSTTPQETFESRFWRFLQNTKYKHWAPAPGKTDDTYPGKGPHGAYLRMYLNRVAAGRPDELPIGSIIVKENYSSDQKTLSAITVMYRARGFDPEFGNWYWIKYNPGGSVARNEAGQRLAGRVEGCINCHSGAAGNDYLFANDPQ